MADKNRSSEYIWLTTIDELEQKRNLQELTIDELFTLAVCYANTGRLHEATKLFGEVDRLESSAEARKKRVASYQEALEGDPQNMVALNRLAFAYYAIGNYEASVQYFEILLTLDPRNEWTRNYLAYALYQCGRLDEAIGVLQDNLLINPRNSYTHALLGMAYYEKKWYFRALEEMGKGRTAIQDLLTF